MKSRYDYANKNKFSGTGSSSSTSSETSSSSSAAPTKIYSDLDVPLKKVTFANGFVLDATYSIGSGASHYANDAANTVYLLSDRGPVINCSESETLTGASVCDAGEIFPVSNFSPMILKAEIANDTITITDTIKLTDSNGSLVFGTAPELSNYNVKAYDENGTLLDSNIDGINPGSIVKTTDGFYIGDKYAPSIFKVDNNGKVLEKIIVENTMSDNNNSGYVLTEALPKILNKISSNKGISALAVDSSYTQLFFTTEAPLNNPDSVVSRNIRIYQYGVENKIIKEFWYKLNNNVASISEIVAIDKETLLIGATCKFNNYK